MRRKAVSNNPMFSQYLKENVTLYIFTVILFVMGVIFGSFIIHSLSLTQKQELISYVSNFFFDLNNNEFAGSNVAFKEVLFDNFKYLLILWFLGLSIIGMPLIFLIIFMKGFLIGFTISFFISQLQFRGFLFSLVSIVPQNLLIVPVMIIAGVAGILFSLSLIKGRGKTSTPNFQQSFVSYSLFIALLGVILVVASLFETFISPYLMKVVTTYFIQG